MIHPNVLRDSGIDPKVYSGFAFGIGIDRLGFMKYEFDDVRSLYSGDLRFVNQF
jgi:phenylalanyl-tRNA synthetase alpha chain